MPKSLWLVTVLIAVIAAAGTTSDLLVFRDGSRLDGVRAELKGDMVWVTLASGAMQAYPAEEVDLEASGLLAQPTPTPAPDENPPEMAGGARLTDARARSSGKSSLKITDADVEHVAPEEEQAEEEGTGVGTEGPLKVAGITHTRVGDRIQVLGTVTNTTYRAVSDVLLEAVAIDADGRRIGSVREPLGRPVEPQANASFKLWIDGQGMAAEVRVRARAGGAERGDGGPNPGRPVPPGAGRPAGSGGEG